MKTSSFIFSVCSLIALSTNVQAEGGNDNFIKYPAKCTDIELNGHLDLLNSAIGRGGAPSKGIAQVSHTYEVTNEEIKSLDLPDAAQSKEVENSWNQANPGKTIHVFACNTTLHYKDGTNETGVIGFLPPFNSSPIIWFAQPN